MALSRTFLEGLGLTEGQVEAIVEGNAESLKGLKEQINGLKAEVEKYRADAEKLAATQQELDELKASASEETKKSEEREKDLDALRKEYDAYKAEQEGKETTARKTAAYRALLGSMNMSEKGIAKASKYFDLSKIELTKEGKIKDEEAIRTATREEWGEYLPEVSEVKNEVATPPANTGGGSGLTKKQILEIKDTQERQKAIAENHELFGF